MTTDDSADKGADFTQRFIDVTADLVGAMADLALNRLEELLIPHVPKAARASRAGLTDSLIDEFLHLFGDLFGEKASAGRTDVGAEERMACQICKGTVPGTPEGLLLCQLCAAVLGWDGCAATVTPTFTVSRSGVK